MRLNYLLKGCCALLVGLLTSSVHAEQPPVDPDPMPGEEIRACVETFSLCLDVCFEEEEIRPCLEQCREALQECLPARPIRDDNRSGYEDRKGEDGECVDVFYECASACRENNEDPDACTSECREAFWTCVSAEFPEPEIPEPELPPCFENFRACRLACRDAEDELACVTECFDTLDACLESAE